MPYCVAFPLHGSLTVAHPAVWACLLPSQTLTLILVVEAQPLLWMHTLVVDAHPCWGCTPLLWMHILVVDAQPTGLDSSSDAKVQELNGCTHALVPGQIA